MAKNSKGSTLGIILGIGAGAVAAAVGVYAASKIAKEINEDSQSITIVSPDEKNLVTITCGSSPFARGLTLVKVKAEKNGDDCNLSFLVGKSCTIAFDWKTDNYIEILVSGGKRTKVCTVNFEGENINITLKNKKEQ